MAEITAASVKELRERTGAGMMDCKKALSETNGEMEPAIDWLRAKGLSAAAKKAGRTAAEGLVGVTVEGHRGAAVEINSETDFVAKNELFQDFVRNVAKLVLTHGTDVEALGAAVARDGNADETFSSRAASLLGGSSETLGTQPVDRGFHLTVAFGERFLAIHHSGASALAEFLHGRGRNLSHLSNPSKRPSVAGAHHALI